MDVHFHINLARPRWSRNWSLRRKVMLFLALALLLPPAAFVAASDTFSDVPDNSGFHDDIEAIYGARITNGTSPGIYSPGLPVTREQMAAFLHRGLPRVAFNSATGNSILGNTSKDRGVVTINTGGATGGTGVVKLDASLLAYTTDTTGCPCEVQFEIAQDGGGASSTYFVTVYNEQAGVDGNTSGSVTWAATVPTASTQTFRLRVKKNSGTAEVRSAGAITAIYVPFGSTGEDVLAAQSIETPDESDAQELKAQKNKSYKQ
jgi:hypothetical protein